MLPPSTKTNRRGRVGRGSLSTSRLALLAEAPAAAAPTLYVTENSSNFVSVYQPGAGAGLSSSPTGANTGVQPKAIAISPNGQSAYVANWSDATVSQYDVLADGSLSSKSTATVADVAGDYPSAIAVSPDGHSVYVTNSSDNTVPIYYEIGGAA
jgi:DNA-binding beta-propeller fold protein YncE